MLPPTDEAPERLSAYQAFALVAGPVAAAAALTVLVFSGMAGVGFLANNSWIVWAVGIAALVFVAFRLRARRRRAMQEEAEGLDSGRLH